ncbi:flowering-promoting factor 1-like protein 5 [Nymphaea colorata]|uniref:Flowering-promoting factor 1-like protein 1 n=1 Tax=Nymphaea colorata TaxID=210225 RepID=A0A5K1CX22_9MAGN|nr:flowering-promoting factor 1-like protein 5 [Nymphaea colorata]
MAGVWTFRHGVVRRMACPSSMEAATDDGKEASWSKRRVLVHVATGQVVSSNEQLERYLLGLGWERYYHGGAPAAGRPDLIQFHRSPETADLISVPSDFARFKSTHMFDIVVKNRLHFQVREI